MKMGTSLPILLFLFCIAALFLGLRKEKNFVVSAYSDNTHPDVYLMGFSRSGNPEEYASAQVWNNPSYFTLTPDGAIWFVNEVSSFAGREGGGITTMRKDKRELRQVVGSSINQGGGGPCFVTLSGDRGYLLTANYGSGSVSVVKLGAEGVPEKVTDTVFFDAPDSLVSHPHMVLYNRKADVYYVTDLGLDRIFIFTLDTHDGRLVPAAVPYTEVVKGSGPRHMVMDKECRSLFVANELSSTVSVFDIRQTTPVPVQTISALPEGFSGESFCGDICLAPSGRYLYVTNRGNNTIGVFNVKGDALSLAGHVSCGGNWPRNMAINKSGRRIIVCNQRSGDLAFFRVSRRGGMPVKEDITFRVNAPSCVKFIE